MDFGKTLLEFRAKHNLTQTQLAKLLGVGIVMIHKYEHGINKPTAVNRIRFTKKMEEYERSAKNV